MDADRFRSIVFEHAGGRMEQSAAGEVIGDSRYPGRIARPSTNGYVSHFGDGGGDRDIEDLLAVPAPPRWVDIWAHADSQAVNGAHHHPGAKAMGGAGVDGGPDHSLRDAVRGDGLEVGVADLAAMAWAGLMLGWKYKWGVIAVAASLLLLLLPGAEHFLG